MSVDPAAAALAAVLASGRHPILDLQAPGRLPGIPLDHLAPLFSEVRGAPEGSAWLRLGAPPARSGPPLGLTVIIPTDKPEAPQAIAALCAQRPVVDVLVLVNGQTDPALPSGVRALRVPWQGHGGTRAAALATVRTPFVAFLSDDARPLGAGWAAEAVSALVASGADGVVCRQVPWPDADPVTRARIRAWTPPIAGPAPQADHVATVWRREALQRPALQLAPIAEDAWWSLGRRVWRAVLAPVLHSHPRDPQALFLRERAIHAELRAMGRAVAVPSVPAALRASAAVVGAAWHAPARIAADLGEVWGQWAGGRVAPR